MRKGLQHGKGRSIMSGDFIWKRKVFDEKNVMEMRLWEGDSTMRRNSLFLGKRDSCMRRHNGSDKIECARPFAIPKNENTKVHPLPAAPPLSSRAAQQQSSRTAEQRPPKKSQQQYDCWVSIARSRSGPASDCGAQNPEPEPWNPGTLGTLEPRNAGTLEPLELWSLEMWNFWNPKTFKPFGILEPWNPIESWNQPWKEPSNSEIPETLQLWNPELWNSEPCNSGKPSDAGTLDL